MVTGSSSPLPPEDSHGHHYLMDRGQTDPTTFRLGPGAPGALAVSNANFTNGGLQRQFDTTAFLSTDRISTGTKLHGLQMGDRIQFNAAPTGGAGLAAATTYFVRDVTPTSFKVSTTWGGAAVDITSDMTAGVLARFDTTQALRTTRDAGEVFNNYTKIGHGDHFYRHRTGGPATALRSGDIEISVGNDIDLANTANRPFADSAYAFNPLGLNFADQLLIGHIDSKFNLQDPFRSTTGNTYIAVSRDNPFSDGTGSFATNGSKVMISSAGEGVLGELRIYMPSAATDLMGPNLYLNSVDYARGGITAEATEGVFSTGTYGELDYAFIPEGTPQGSFGGYGLFYGAVRPVPPVIPGTVIPLPTVDELLARHRRSF